MHNVRKGVTAVVMACLLASGLGVPALVSAAGNAAPVITSTVPTSPLPAGTLFSYQLSATDADGDSLSYTIGKTIQGMSITSSGLVQWTPKIAGSFNVEFRVQDSFGNITVQPATITVSHTTIASIALTPSAAALFAGESKTWSVSATDQYHNTWDVTGLATFTSSPEAAGSWAGTTYTSQVAGTWSVTATVGGLTVTAPLTVTQNTPVKLDINPSATTITADEQLPVSTRLSDTKGNSWDATGFSTITTDEPTGKVDNAVYTPTKKGNWKVNAAVASLNAQSDVTVTPGAAAFISISPSGSQISLAVNQTKSFICTVTDKKGNEIANANIHWGTIGSIGIIDPVGVFTAMKSGKGSVTAAVNDLTVDVDVTVNASPVVKVASVKIVKPQGQVKGESVDQEVAVAPIPTSSATTKNESSSCAIPSLALALSLYAAFIIILLGYYFLTRKEMDLSWWIFPILLTIIGIIVWSKYFCGAYRWWPWVLGLLGLGLSAYLRNRQPAQRLGPPLEKPPVTF